MKALCYNSFKFSQRMRSRLQFAGALAVDIDIRNKEQIARAINFVVQIARLADGRRRVVSISEITGIDSGVIGMQSLYEYREGGDLLFPTGMRASFFDSGDSTGVPADCLHRCRATVRIRFHSISNFSLKSILDEFKRRIGALFFSRRMKKCRDQFSAALAVMANSLRAGISLQQSIKSAAGEIPAPLGEELAMSSTISRAAFRRARSR